MNNWLIYIFSLVLPCYAYSQNNVTYPDFFSGFQNSMLFVNNGYVPENLKADFQGAYRFQTGPFKQISTFNFSGAKILSRENGNKHLFGVLLFNEKQGPFITNPRAYLNYAFQIKLSEKSTFAAGLAFGFTEKFYSGSSATNSNIFLPDASAGLFYTDQKLKIGISSLQILNSTSKLAGDLIYKRYFQFYGEYNIPLNEDWLFRTHGVYRLLPVVKDEWLAGGTLYFKESAGVGAMIRSNYNLCLQLHINLASESDKISLYFSYNNPVISPYSFTQTTMEIGLGYGIY